MPSTPKNIIIPVNEWVNLNELSNINPGTKIIIDNTGSSEVRLSISFTKPELNSDSYIYIMPRSLPMTSNGKNAYPIWAYSGNCTGKLNVREFYDA